MSKEGNTWSLTRRPCQKPRHEKTTSPYRSIRVGWAPRRSSDDQTTTCVRHQGGLVSKSVWARRGLPLWLELSEIREQRYFCQSFSAIEAFQLDLYGDSGWISGHWPVSPLGWQSQVFEKVLLRLPILMTECQTYGNAICDNYLPCCALEVSLWSVV